MRAIANESPLLFMVSGQSSFAAPDLLRFKVVSICFANKSNDSISKPVEIEGLFMVFHVEVIVVLMLIVYSFFWNLLVS